MKALPLHPDTSQNTAREFRKVSDDVELIEIHAVPRDLWILGERGLHFLSKCVLGCVGLLQRSALRIRNNAWPGCICLAEGHGVSVARSAIASQGFIGHFGDMRTTHDHR